MTPPKVKLLKNNRISYLAFAAASLALAAPAMAGAPVASDSADKNPKSEAQKPPARGLGEYLSGRFARSHGDAHNALQYLQDAHAKDPKNIATSVQLRDALIQEGKIDEAVQVAQSTYESNKKDAVSSLLLSLAAVKKKDFTAAAGFFDDAPDEASGQLWVPLVTGWMDVGRGVLKKPLTIEGLSANVGVARAVASYHLGLINAAAGFTDAAAENFSHAVEEPTNPPPRVMNAILQFNEKNKSPKALEKLVQIYTQSHPDYTVDKDQVVATPADGVSEVLFTMATIALRAQMPRDTVVYLQLALYTKPDFPLALVMLGSSYEQLQDYEKSNIAFAKVPEGSDFYQQVQEYIASNLDHMGKTDEALAKLDRMAAGKDKPENALMAKGDMLRSHKRFAEAGEVYARALEKIPANHPLRWALFFARGVCNERLGKWSDAEKDLKQALVINPNQPDVLNYLGYGWLERGEHLDEARGMIEKAVKVRPNDPQIVDSMGWALYLSGRYKEAVPYMEKAVQLLPGDSEVNSHLGDVYWRVGRKNEAKFQWERALTFKPDAKLEDALNKKLKDGLPAVKVADKADAKSL